jgi:Family of unknown function (DUF6159)
MFKRIARGWRMAGASWSVLKQHPKLLIFPVLSGIAFCAIMAAIGYSVFTVSDGFRSEFFDSLKPNDPIVYAAVFAFYAVCSFVVIFFNSALVYCALEAFTGRTPSLGTGLTAAVARLPQILGWTLVTATVGLLLSILQSFLRDKLGFLGSLLGGVFEVAWNVVTYFVVPVLVVDGVGPIEAVKRSSSILRKTWGETVGGEGGMGLVGFLLFLPVVGVIGVTVMIGRETGISGSVVAVLGTLVLAYLVLLTVVFSALGTIFRTGAYIYATTGTPPASMDAGLLQTTFRKK